MKRNWSFELRILIRREDDLWVAHCLELDLVAAALTEKQAEEDIIAVIMEQVRYCIVNDNMDYLFRKVPKEIREEYYACERSEQPTTRLVEAPSTKDRLSPDYPPISFTANSCRSLSACRA